VPAADPGRFNLLIDGAARASNVGNGGTTGAVVLPPGTHIVSEAVGAGTSLGGYRQSFSGDCDSGGHVTLVPGDNKTCTVTNAKIAIPPPNCPHPGDICCETDPETGECTQCVTPPQHCP